MRLSGAGGHTFLQQHGGGAKLGDDCGLWQQPTKVHAGVSQTRRPAGDACCRRPGPTLRHPSRLSAICGRPPPSARDHRECGDIFTRGSRRGHGGEGHGAPKTIVPQHHATGHHCRPPLFDLKNRPRYRTTRPPGADRRPPLALSVLAADYTDAPALDDKGKVWEVLYRSTRDIAARTRGSLLPQVCACSPPAKYARHVPAAGCPNIAAARHCDAAARATHRERLPGHRRRRQQ